MFQANHCDERVVFLEPLCVCAVRVCTFSDCKFWIDLGRICDEIQILKIRDEKRLRAIVLIHALSTNVTTKKRMYTHTHTRSASIHYKRSKCTGSSKEWPIRIWWNNLRDANVRSLKIGGHGRTLNEGQLIFFNWMIDSLACCSSFGHHWLSSFSFNTPTIDHQSDWCQYVNMGTWTF